jgi:dihydropyrimidinase
VWRSFSGLRNGTFTVYSSDHCPFRYDDPKGKMLGLLSDKETMEGHSVEDACKDLVEFAKGKKGHFKYVPNGCPGIETRLPILFNKGVLEGRISPEKFVELTSTNAAKLASVSSLFTMKSYTFFYVMAYHAILQYGMYPQKGALLPGLSDADLTIWYPEGKMTPFKLTNDHLHHNVDCKQFHLPFLTLLRH